jgi:hypothetical protein
VKQECSLLWGARSHSSARGAQGEERALRVNHELRLHLCPSAGEPGLQRLCHSEIFRPALAELGLVVQQSGRQ